MLPLARAIPLNGPEPRWDEISLPSGTPLCIPYVETYRHSIYGLHKFADAVERAQSKVLQRRIRRDPPGLSRSSNPTASYRLPDRPSIYHPGIVNSWEAVFSRIRRATLLSYRNTVTKSTTTTVILKYVTGGPAVPCYT